MQNPPGFDQQPPTPHRRRALRRHEWLAIYLPMIIGLGAAIALGVALWRREVGSASLWSDISLIFLMIFGLVFALLLLILLIAIVVGLVYAIRWLPLPTQRGRSLAAQMDRAVRNGAGMAAKPIVIPKGIWAALLAGLRTLISIFRAPRRGVP